MNEIEIFRNRLKKIGIEIELMGNIPWIYLMSVNANKIKKEDWTANYGYTIGWWMDTPVLEENFKKHFEIIRKYR